MDYTDTSSPSAVMGGDGLIETAAEIDQGSPETPPDARMRNIVGGQDEDGAQATGRQPIHEEGHPEEKKDECGDSSMRKYPETGFDKQDPAANSEDDGVPTGMADDSDSDEPHVETGARQEFIVIHENNNSVDFDASIEMDDRSDNDHAGETELATAAADMDAEEERQPRQEEPEPADVIDNISTPTSQADSTGIGSATSHNPPQTSEADSVPATAVKTGASNFDGDVPNGTADESDEPHVESEPRQELTVRNESSNVGFDAQIKTDDLGDSDGQVVASETESADAADEMGAEEERQPHNHKVEPPAEIIENISTLPPQEDVTETSSHGSRTPPSTSEADSVPTTAVKTGANEDGDVPTATGMGDGSDEPHVESRSRQQFAVRHENNNSVDFDAPIKTDDLGDSDGQVVASETESADAADEMGAEEERQPHNHKVEPPAEIIENISTLPPQEDVTETSSHGSRTPPSTSEADSVPTTAVKTGANEDGDVPTATGMGDGSDEPHVESRSRQQFAVRHENNNSVDFDAPIKTDDLGDSDRQVVASETESADAAEDMDAEEERESRKHKVEPPAEVIENISTLPPQEDVTETRSPGSRTPPSASEAESAPASAAKDSEAEKRQSPEPIEEVEKISAPPPQADATDMGSAASQTPPPVKRRQQPMAEPSRVESAQHHPLRDMNELPLRASKVTYASSSVGRRSIHLRLLEERLPEQTSEKSSPAPRSIKAPFKDSLRRIRSLSLSSAIQTVPKAMSTANRPASIPSALEVLDEKAPSPVKDRWVDRGTISVSWYEGTTSSEMTDHVFNCVLRKLYQCDDHKDQGKLRLKSVRLLDENVTPHGGTSFAN